MRTKHYTFGEQSPNYELTKKEELKKAEEESREKEKEGEMGEMGEKKWRKEKEKVILKELGEGENNLTRKERH